MDSGMHETTGDSLPLAGSGVGNGAEADLLEFCPALREGAYRWACLYTRPRHEKSIARVCERDGVRHYLPLVKTVRHYGKRTRESWLPFFPGYLFCCVSPEQRYRLSNEDNLLSVFDVYDQEKLLRELHEVRKALEVSAALRKLPYLAKGKRVRIRCGPFRGIVGVVLESRRHCRVLLNVTFIRQSVPLEVDVGDLEPMP